ncbi:MAG: hypothetical protein CMJ58_07030 [Planctomycetaceae bacterium]|nr:hypothetical protein [Planctomycetaceae bacterium]
MTTALQKRSLAHRLAAAGTVDASILRSRLRRMAYSLWPYAVLALLAVYPAARSWRTGLDPLVDFGRELYVPWQLAEGATLYRDIAYFNGPLSPYLNAVWFQLFGASLATLMAANLAVLGAITALTFHLLSRIASRGAALAASALLPLLFGFGNYGTIANYNFVTPYSHELTHGLLLALLALAAAWQGDKPRRRTALLAGLFIGATFLTKPELTAAAAAGAAASHAAMCFAAGTSWRRVLRQVTIMAAGAVATPLVAIAWLATMMPLPEAVDACLGAWRMAGMAEIRQLDFYRECVGTLDLPMSLRNIVVSLAHGAAVLGAADILDRRIADDRRRWWALALGLCGGALLIVEGYYWPIIERALPMWLAILTFWWAARLVRARKRRLARVQDDDRHEGTAVSDDPRPSPELPQAGRGDVVAALRLGWCVFALVMLGKIALFARVMHYGFALALPAALTVVVAVLDWIPRRGRRRCRGSTLPWLFLPLLAAYLLAYQVQHSMHIHRETAVGLSPQDQFFADADAAPVATALDTIAAYVAADETVAVLPEGVMLNFLSRRASGTKFITWMPPEVLFFGEEAMLADLAAAAPDWIVLAPRDLDEYGYRGFGDDYCRATAAWIDAHYRPVTTWDDDHWRLLRRRDLSERHVSTTD